MRRPPLSIGLVELCALIALSCLAAFSEQELIVNGCPFGCDPPPLELEGRRLLPLSVVTSRLGVSARQDETGLWELDYFGRCLAVRRNTPAYLIDEEPGRATAEPVEFGEQLYVPLTTLARAFDWDVQTLATADRRWAEIDTGGAEVLGVRTGPRQDSFRLVLDVDRPTPFAWRQAAGMVRVTVPTGPPRPGIVGRPQPQLYDHALVSSVQHVRDETATDVFVELRDDAVADVFTLASPHRIVVDVMRPAGAKGLPDEMRPTGPWQRRNFGTARGSARANVLTIDTRQEGVELRPALANFMIRAKDRASIIAQREGAVAAINGGYFARTGEPLGLLVIDGEYITAPPRARTALVMHEDGSLAIERVGLSARAMFPGVGARAITAVNEGHRGGDEVILYTRRYARELGGNLKTTRVAVDRSGVVTEVMSRTNAPLTVPEDGAVLSARGALVEPLAKIRPGQRVAVEMGTDPPLPGMRHVLGAGPRLLRNGEVEITATQEGFRPDVTRGAAPRSALGITAEGELIMLTVDGRGAGGSTGMTMYELARTLLQLGARDAMSLDGGGSSTMVIASHIVNSPSDGVARRVSNALLVFADLALLGLPAL